MESVSEINLSLPMPKPLEAINKLIAVLRLESLPLKMENNKTLITLNPPEEQDRVILVLEGALIIHRTADNLRLARAGAPNIFGMQGSAFRYNLYKFTSEKDILIETLPLSRALELIEQYQLFKELLEFQSYLSDFQAYRTNLLISKSTYHIVCALLLELQALPEEERVQTSVYNHIYEHSHLARSGVMKILSDLRQGEYINIENGKLIGILKKFPRDY